MRRRRVRRSATSGRSGSAAQRRSGRRRRRRRQPRRCCRRRAPRAGRAAVWGACARRPAAPPAQGRGGGRGCGLRPGRTMRAVMPSAMRAAMRRAVQPCGRRRSGAAKSQGPVPRSFSSGVQRASHRAAARLPGGAPRERPRRGRPEQRPRSQRVRRAAEGPRARRLRRRRARQQRRRQPRQRRRQRRLARRLAGVPRAGAARRGCRSPARQRRRRLIRACRVLLCLLCKLCECGWVALKSIARGRRCLTARAGVGSCQGVLQGRARAQFKICRRAVAAARGDAGHEGRRAPAGGCGAPKAGRVRARVTARAASSPCSPPPPCGARRCPPWPLCRRPGTFGRVPAGGRRGAAAGAARPAQP
jgi:hypothetical protein